MKLTTQLQDNIPELAVLLYGVGHIPTGQSAQVPGDAKTFTVSLVDYVGGSPKGSTVQCVIVNFICRITLILPCRCVFSATRRWVNVPVPNVRSCIQFLGFCNGFSDSGLLRVQIEHITFGVGPHGLSTPDSSSPSASTTPTKRKKYSAHGNLPSSAATGDAGPSSFNNSPAAGASGVTLR